MDRAEFAPFVETRSDALLRTAFLLTGSWPSAEDLLQVALARCWRVWPRLSDQPEAYVRKVLLNSYLSWRRRRWHDETPVAEPPDAPGPDETSSVADREVLWDALRRLPRRQRAVIVLRYFEDRSEADTAELLGVTRGTVKSQTSKALAALRVDPDLVRESTKKVTTGVLDD
jgi:RNA polymerase sigma-70 factor (sigma-E family)